MFVKEYELECHSVLQCNVKMIILCSLDTYIQLLTAAHTFHQISPRYQETNLLY